MTYFFVNSTNAGGPGTNLTISTGTEVYTVSSSTIINMTGIPNPPYTSPTIFRSHRWKWGSVNTTAFTVTVTGLEPWSYNQLSLGFAETWNGGCNIGARKFAIKVNGQYFATSLDVFQEAGCKTASVISKNLIADINGNIEIVFIPMANNAFYSSIEISTTKAPTQAPSEKPSSRPSEKSSVSTMPRHVPSS
jgi:hypothetical protein